MPTMSGTSTNTCPKCFSSIHVRAKKILIGKASPKLLFEEERAGYQRKDQLAMDECKPETMGAHPLEQFLDGYFCTNCDIGFVSDCARSV